MYVGAECKWFLLSGDVYVHRLHFVVECADKKTNLEYPV